MLSDRRGTEEEMMSQRRKEVLRRRGSMRTEKGQKEGKVVEEGDQ